MQKNSVIMKCCVCKRIKTERGWQYKFVTMADGEFVSHGYCPVCYKQALHQLEAETETVGTLLEIAR